MVSEVKGSGYGYDTLYGVGRTDSVSSNAERQDKSAKSAPKTATEDQASSFSVAIKAKNTDTRKSIQPNQYEKDSSTFLRNALSKPYSQGADLYGSSLAGRSLQGSNLNLSDLRSSELTGTNLAGADLRGADLTGANLAGADLTGANVTGANFTGANIQGANLRGTIGSTYDANGNVTIDKAIRLSNIDLLA